MLFILLCWKNWCKTSLLINLDDFLNVIIGQNLGLYRVLRKVDKILTAFDKYGVFNTCLCIKWIQR